MATYSDSIRRSNQKLKQGFEWSSVHKASANSEGAKTNFVVKLFLYDAIK